MRVIVFLALVACCQPYKEPAPDHYRDQVSSEIFKIEGQDETWLIQRPRVEAYLGNHVENLLQYDWNENKLAVWWVDDQPCPYKPERNAIIGCKDQDCPKRCYAGQTWGPAEIYVATYQRDPTTSCGTALVHEYGHAMRWLAGKSGDLHHEDDQYWSEVLPAISAIMCDRLGSSVSAREEQTRLDAELSAGVCGASLH